MDITIIIDTREKTPWQFKNSKVQGMKTGDYTIAGLEDVVCIERKSTEDFVNSLIHNRIRFFKELERMKAFEHKWVIVEGSWFDIFEHQYVSKAAPNSIKGLACKIMIDFGIPVIMAGDKFIANEMCERLLKRVALLKSEVK